MSTLDDSFEQWQFSAGTHWSQQEELQRGLHSTGRQRTLDNYEGKHRAEVGLKNVN